MFTTTTQQHMGKNADKTRWSGRSVLFLVYGARAHARAVQHQRAPGSWHGQVDIDESVDCACMFCFTPHHAAKRGNKEESMHRYNLMQAMEHMQKTRCQSQNMHMYEAMLRRFNICQ